MLLRSLTARPRKVQKLEAVELLRKGEQLTFVQWPDYFLAALSKPPARARKTHLSLYPGGKAS